MGAPSLEVQHQQLQVQYQQMVERLHQLELQQNNAAQAAANAPAPPAAPQPVAPENAEAENAAEVNAVRNLKIPPFWSENPALWFAQVEATFDLHKITADATRYRHVITQLDSRTLPAIADIIVNPPPAQKYQAIKTLIMSSFAETTESKLRRLLRGLDPTNDKPTLLLQRIRNLADGQVGDALLRTLFLEQLPEYVRGVLVISGDLDLSTLARQADKVMEATQSTCIAAVQPSTSVAAVQQSAQPKHTAAVTREPGMHELILAVSALTKVIKSLKSEERSRSRSSSRARGTSADRAANDSNLCYFHAKFGDDARKCQKPCSKASEN